MAFDGLGRRIRKTIDPDDTAVDYDYYYNASWQVLEVRKNNDEDTLKRYVWSLRYINEPVVRFYDGDTDGSLSGGSDNTLYYCVDANQNVTALLSPPFFVVERYHYDPYGRVHVFDGNWSARTTDVYDNDILYCGYLLDRELGGLDGSTGELYGLYHVRHRAYHPALGRWLQRDPAGNVDGPGRYQYARSRVTVGRDPSGAAWMSPYAGTGTDNITIGSCTVSSYMDMAYNYTPVDAGEAIILNEGTDNRMSGIRTVGGSLVSYRMADWWARSYYKDAQMTPEIWEQFAKTHDARQPCGKEITAALEDVYKRIEPWFRGSLDDAQRSKACCVAFDLFEDGPNIRAGCAWDINELFEMSSTGIKEPARSVRVSKRCYDAAAVNYVMFGLMAKLCDKDEDDAFRRIAAWKKVWYGHLVDPETEAWFRAGFRGWTPAQQVDSFTPYSLDTPASETVQHMKFTWLPYMLKGEQGDYRLEGRLGCR